MPAFFFPASVTIYVSCFEFVLVFLCPLLCHSFSVYAIVFLRGNEGWTTATYNAAETDYFFHGFPLNNLKSNNVSRETLLGQNGNGTVIEHYLFPANKFISGIFSVV